MAKKPAAPVKDEFDKLRERFSLAQERWYKDRQRYKDDMHFLHVDHWPQGVRSSRQNAINPRLCLEIDQLSQYQRQVINDSRQNRPQIKVRPVDNNADIETATVFDGLCRHWQEASNADTCYDIALECATGGGFGYFRILHEYLHANTFDQDLCFAPVSNPLTVYYGEHKQPDGSDAKECWIGEEIPKAQYEAEYPGFKTQNWEMDGTKYGDWGGEKVRVMELYEIREEPRTMYLLADSTVCTEADYQKAIDQGLTPSPIKDSRVIPQKVLYWSKMNGAEYIEEPRIEPGDRIPVFPVWANVQVIDGEVIRTSMIHKSKDAQLLYDYAQTAFAERVGQTPEATWVAAEGQIDPYSKEWDGSEWVSARTYKPMTLEGQLLPAPQRSSPTDIPAGFAQTMQMAEHGIQTTLGMYSATIGKKGNATSGIQEQEQARKGDVSTFHYHDNLARAIRSAGRYLVSAAPKVLDSVRVVRILGLDGQASMVQIDPSQPNASQKLGAKSIFNLGVGTYDVAVDVGASYQTTRQASAAGMLALAQADPTMWQTHGDLIAEAQDWPEAQRFAQRSKLLLPPQIQQAESQHEGHSPEVQQALMQVQQVTQEAQQAIQQREQALQQMSQELNQLKQEAGSKAGELQIKEMELKIKAFEAETKRMELQGNDSGEKLNLDWEKAKLASATTVEVAQINRQTALDTTLMQAEQNADRTLTADLGGMPRDESLPPPVKPKKPLDTILETLDNHAHMLNGLHQTLHAPRVKRATAVKQPDGTFQIESVESLQ